MTNQADGLKIRAARNHEAKRLSELAFRSKRYWGYDAEFMERCRDDLTYTSAKIDSPDFDFKVYEENVQVIAFYALHYLQPGVAELEALFVDPPRIGCGIGRHLAEHAKMTASERAVKKIIIQSDPNAQAFYLSLGGRFIGNRESVSIPGRYLPLFEFSL
ncbi:MAG: GNAT family N-acetyltransferase [Woeseiaceae bacterium]